MCLYTRMVLNPKFKPNKKNGGNPPICTDERIKYIPVECGNCAECRKKKKREWQIRLMEEQKNDKTGKFITLTFNEEELYKIEEIAGTKEANECATVAVRRFLERWRKKHKKSVKHWLITELGHNGTERLHLHGIIYTKEEKEEIEKIWKYGNIHIGYSMNERCINYIIKYITKTDKDHKGYIGKILCSKGIGRGYEETYNGKQNKYVPRGTKETYRLNNGAKTGLPQYYRKKIYTEEEREKLWIEKIEKQIVYVMGRKINISTEEGQKEYQEAIRYYATKTKQMGYGDGGKRKSYMTRNGIKNIETERKKYKMLINDKKIRKTNEKFAELKKSFNFAEWLRNKEQ